MAAKAWRVQYDANAEGVGYMCPGCEAPHVVPIGPGRWKFNGDYESPTLEPSVDCPKIGCHATIRDGKAYFADTSLKHPNECLNLLDLPPERR